MRKSLCQFGAIFTAIAIMIGLLIWGINISSSGREKTAVKKIPVDCGNPVTMTKGNCSTIRLNMTLAKDSTVLQDEPTLRDFRSLFDTFEKEHPELEVKGREILSFERRGSLVIRAIIIHHRPRKQTAAERAQSRSLGQHFVRDNN